MHKLEITHYSQNDKTLFGFCLYLLLIDNDLRLLLNRRKKINLLLSFEIATVTMKVNMFIGDFVEYIFIYILDFLDRS